MSGVIVLEFKYGGLFYAKHDGWLQEVHLSYIRTSINGLPLESAIQVNKTWFYLLLQYLLISYLYTVTFYSF